MKQKIKTALRDSGYIIVIGVDPAMSRNAGIAFVKYHPERMIAEPIITRTFHGMKHLHVVEYFTEMRRLLEPDIVSAIGTEESYGGQFKAIPYGVGRARGIAEGIACTIWPGIIIESFKPSAWRSVAFGNGRITKREAFLTAEADFKNPRFPDAAIIGELTEDASEAYHIARATAIKLITE